MSVYQLFRDDTLDIKSFAKIQFFLIDKKISSDKRRGDEWGFLLPFWIRFSSTFRSEGRANPERRQSEGRVEAYRLLYMPKKPKIRGAAFEKNQF